jgi:hypothetical protein
MDIMVEMQQKYHNVSGDPDKAQAWAAFWAAAEKTKGDWESVAKDFFKKPLMQHSYGKDASMFGDVLAEMIESDDRYYALFEQIILPLYNGDGAAAIKDLSLSTELALRNIIDSRSTQVMNKLGRNFAMINKPLVVQGTSGDDLVVGPVGMNLINENATDGRIFVDKKTDNGIPYKLKKPAHVVDHLFDLETGETEHVPSVEMGFDMAQAKGEMRDPTGMRYTQKFINRDTMTYDEFHNYLGSSMARSLGVLLIQSIDGDLVKFTTIEANKGLKYTRPVIWVHDSIISTPGQMLIYQNIYNNIAIPKAVVEMKSLGKRIIDARNEERDALLKRVKEKGQPVSIGSEGDYKVVGAILDEYYNRIDPRDESYKNLFLKRKEAEKVFAPTNTATNRQNLFDKLVEQKNKQIESGAEADWNEYVKRIERILGEAIEAGWLTPKQLPGAARKYLAVSPAQFEKLFMLAEELIGASGPSSNLQAWFNAQASRIDRTYTNLMRNTELGGIWQMSPSGNSPAKDLGGKSILPRAIPVSFSEIPPMDNPFDQGFVIPPKPRGERILEEEFTVPDFEVREEPAPVSPQESLKKFKKVADAWLKYRDPKPLQEYIAEVRKKHGEETAQRSEKELKAYIKARGEELARNRASWQDE